MTFTQEFSRVMSQMGMTTKVPLSIPVTLPPVKFVAAPLRGSLAPELSNFLSMMAFHEHHSGLTGQTRWGIGRYNKKDDTTSVVFDQIEGRPEDRVTITMDHVGLVLPQAESDFNVRRLYEHSPHARTNSLLTTEMGISFTYEVGTSARLSQFAIMNSKWGILKEYFSIVSVYHMLLSTAFIRQMADAAKTDEELNRLAETCERGASGAYLDDGIAYLQTGRKPDANVHYDAAFLHAVDVNEKGYDRSVHPVHPLITSLIEGAALLIPNLTDALEDNYIVPQEQYVGSASLRIRRKHY